MLHDIVEMCSTFMPQINTSKCDNVSKHVMRAVFDTRSLYVANAETMCLPICIQDIHEFPDLQS